MPALSFFLFLFLFVSYRSPVGRFNDGPIDGEYDWVNPAQMALVVESLQNKTMNKENKERKEKKRKTLNDRMSQAQTHG